jgi:hypothetical protein
MFKAQHGRRNGSRLRPGNAHNTDATPAGRSCYGDDSVVKIHKEIVAGERRALASRALLGTDGSQTRPHTLHVLNSSEAEGN